MSNKSPIDYISFDGLDNSVSSGFFAWLSEHRELPLPVEQIRFGFLLTKDQLGVNDDIEPLPHSQSLAHSEKTRYPRTKTICHLMREASFEGFGVDLHFCGALAAAILDPGKSLKLAGAFGDAGFLYPMHAMRDKGMAVQLNLEAATLARLVRTTAGGLPAISNSFAAFCEFLGVPNVTLQLHNDAPDYQQKIRDLANHLRQEGLVVRVSIDASRGRGISTQGPWPLPEFPGIKTGYAGGINPENIAERIRAAFTTQHEAARGAGDFGKPFFNVESGCFDGNLFSADRVFAMLEAARDTLADLPQPEALRP